MLSNNVEVFLRIFLCDDECSHKANWDMKIHAMLVRTCLCPKKCPLKSLTHVSAIPATIMNCTWNRVTWWTTRCRWELVQIGPSESFNCPILFTRVNCCCNLKASLLWFTGHSLILIRQTDACCLTNTPTYLLVNREREKTTTSDKIILTKCLFSFSVKTQRQSCKISDFRKISRIHVNVNHC